MGGGGGGPVPWVGAIGLVLIFAATMSHAEYYF